MGNITLTFNNLTAAQAIEIGKLYKAMTEGEASPAPLSPAPVAEPSPAPAVATVHVAPGGGAVGTGAATVAPKLDSRGVPHHPEHHAAGATTNKDGSWRRKKGGDKAAADAYEAPFVQLKAGGAPDASAQAAPTGAMPASPTTGNVMAFPAPPANAVPLAIPTLAAGETVTPEKLDQLWSALAGMGRVNKSHLDYLANMVSNSNPGAGILPGGNVYRTNPDMLAWAWNWLSQYITAA